MKNPLKYLLEPRPLLVNVANISIIVGVASAMITAAIALVGLHHDRIKMSVDRKQRSAELMLKLDDQLEKYQDIMDELDTDNTNSTKVVLHPIGKITDRHLEGYLGLYDTIGVLIKSDLFTCSMAYNEFSYDINMACTNDEIKNYIMEERKQYKDLRGNFLYLCELYKGDRNPCKDLK